MAQPGEPASERARTRPAGSGTVAALDGGIHGIGKKILEEAGEVWLAAEHESDDALAEEISQLLYWTQVLMLSRGGCSFCDTAKALLNERGIGYDEVPANPRRLKAVSGKTTTPQIFIDGEYVGGAAELKDWLEHNA